MIRKVFYLVFILLLVFGLPVVNLADPTSVFAQDKAQEGKEFSTSYDVTYDVGDDGVTTVTEKVTLKNLTSQYYATQFSLTIGSTKIDNVSASDPSGPLETKIEQKGTSETISVKFNQQVVGIGKTLLWTLKFTSRDFASAQGKIWQVSVPKIASTGNLEDYNLTLSVPIGFGQPTTITPTPIKQSSDFGKLFLNFNKAQLEDQGVLANFGDKQLFDFDLAFHLENTNLVPILTNIALPPDTEYQDVIFNRIDPKPLNVTVDEDGNYLAWYRLARNQKLDVRVIGSSKLYVNSKAKNPSLSESLKLKYTEPEKYWESNHLSIKTKLADILGPTGGSLSSLEKARKIHRFVSQTLQYNSKRLTESSVDRLGAVTALTNPTQAVCMEFTDLFIALARAAGIPARELDGFAYTANSDLRPLSLSRDILHAWPEFWDDSRGWIMIDPTWESTTGGVDYFNKLDLNHFAFVIKGLSSEQPVPAGSYKYAGLDSHDVKVTFSENDFLGKPQLDVSIDLQNPILAGLPGKIKVSIQNLGNAEQQSSNLKVYANSLSILGNPKTSGPMPAFGHGDFEFDLRTKSLLDNFSDTITVEVAGQKFTKNVQVQPFLVFRSFPFVLIGIISGLGGIYFAVLGGFIYRKRYMRRKLEKGIKK